MFQPLLLTQSFSASWEGLLPSLLWHGAHCLVQQVEGWESLRGGRATFLHTGQGLECQPGAVTHCKVIGLSITISHIRDVGQSLSQEPHGQKVPSGGSIWDETCPCRGRCLRAKATLYCPRGFTHVLETACLSGIRPWRIGPRSQHGTAVPSGQR